MAEGDDSLDAELCKFLEDECKLGGTGKAEALARVSSELYQHQLSSFKAVYSRYRDDLTSCPDKAFRRMAEDLPSLHDTHLRMLLHEAKDRATLSVVLAVLASAGLVAPTNDELHQKRPSCDSAPHDASTVLSALAEGSPSQAAVHSVALLQGVADRAASAAALLALVCERPSPSPPTCSPAPEQVPPADGAAAEAHAVEESPPHPQEHNSAELPAVAAHGIMSLPEAETDSLRPPAPGADAQEGEQQGQAGPTGGSNAGPDAVSHLDGVEGLLLLSLPGARLPTATQIDADRAPAEVGAGAASAAGNGTEAAAAGPGREAGEAAQESADAQRFELPAGEPFPGGPLPSPLLLQPPPGGFLPGPFPAGFLQLHAGHLHNHQHHHPGFDAGLPLPPADGPMGHGPIPLPAPDADGPLATLEAQEQMIKNVSVAHFMQEAEALLLISEQRLFEAAGFASFSEYITKSGRLRIQLRQARHLVAAARFMRSLPPDLPRPRNERQVRPLTGQPPEVALAAWRLALARAEAAGEGVCNRITAQCVAEVLEQMDAAGLPRPGRRGRAARSPGRGKGRESDSDE